MTFYTLTQALEKIGAEQGHYPCRCGEMRNDPDEWTEHVKLFGQECRCDYSQHYIAREVGSRVVAELGNEWFAFGTFDNCREWGLTFTADSWQFAVYQHRNSDSMCTQGCRVWDVQPYGPWGGDIVDKFDVLTWADWLDYDIAADNLVACLRWVRDNPGATRAELKKAMTDRRFR